MLHSKSLLFFCFGSLAGQTFFHTTHGNGGSYTSITHGASTHGAGVAHNSAAFHGAGVAHNSAAFHGAGVVHNHGTFHGAGVAHKPAAPVYKVTPIQPAYQQPTYTQPAYHQPAYQQPKYQQPAYPTPHSAAPTYGEKCSVDYTEKYAQVCTPTLEAECGHEKVSAGIRITEEYDCYPVTHTICTEYEDIELTDVCAVSYGLEEVVATSQLVDVKWEKNCQEEVFCENPHSAGAYHAAAYCKEQIKSVCALYPVLYPVEQTVVLKLPQPFDTCITKEIALPRVKCQQVTKKRCVTRPRVTLAEQVESDKCEVRLGPEACTEAPIKLPRQVCLDTFKKTKLVYEEES